MPEIPHSSGILSIAVLKVKKNLYTLIDILTREFRRSPMNFRMLYTYVVIAGVEIELPKPAAQHLPFTQNHTREAQGI